MPATKDSKDTGKSKLSTNEKLATLGLVNSWDFALHLPLRYEDQTHITKVAHLVEGEPALISVTIVDQRMIPTSRGAMLIARARDDSGELQLRFIHFYPNTAQTLAAGRTVLAYGVARIGYQGVLEIVHPKLRTNTGPSSSLTPVYPSTEGLQQPTIRKRIDRALLDLDLSDPIPVKYTEGLGLPGFRASLEYLHHPPKNADRESLDDRTCPSWQRLIFDELLAQQITLRISREVSSSAQAPILAPAQTPLAKALRSELPFALTNAQERVLKEIHADMATSHPMHRLVQGDVGSGKTIVATLAALQAIEAGYQAAFMAPTEILAEQHYQKMKAWLEPLGIQCVWLSGKIKASERNKALEAIASGEAKFVVGTHAIIQEGVNFAHLGLAIVDEQHRFGVAQRLSLRTASSDELTAHLLMLSATPIPRTLAMSYLADLDVSVIDELPPGRTPIVTKLFRQSRKEQIYAALLASIDEGHQAYWVCPLVEESEALELTPATQRYEELVKALPSCRIGLVHGQLSSAEKDEVMARFVAGDIDVLVATTVIEVGVDVPNASLMIIEHAERFGLSQLHQLRGRVGRGAAQSSCALLFSDELSDIAKERLRIIRESTDGFEIARRDLQLRGPGEFLGERQSGMPFLRFADLDRDSALLSAATQVAQNWLKEDREGAVKHAKRWFEQQTNLLSA